MKELDEKGFVFIGADGRPYLCRMRGDSPWLFYWHPDNHWVSLKKIGQMEVWQANELSIPDDQAECYHKLQKERFGF